MNVKQSGYIVSPLYDGVFFIFSPLLALAIGIGISGTSFSDEPVTFLGIDGSYASIFLGVFVFAHLALVFFRSHANAYVFSQFPYRFTIVPLALFAAMASSYWILIPMGVLAIWWDVYHSSLQTFGIGRIYDARRGNGATVGRRLDYLLNILLYTGPVLAGATLMDHVEYFEGFSDLGNVFFTSVPAYVESNRRYLTWGVLVLGIPFLIYYVYSYWRLIRQGYQVPFQKVCLLASTGLCSIYTWGFNSFGEAFFIMNLFHAWQYFALVWITENKNMLKVFRLEGIRLGKLILFVLFIGIAFGFGWWSEVTLPDNQMLMSLFMTVSIMHFWYDGFIWSVRRKQV